MIPHAPTLYYAMPYAERRPPDFPALYNRPDRC